MVVAATLNGLGWLPHNFGWLVLLPLSYIFTYLLNKEFAQFQVCGPGLLSYTVLRIVYVLYPSSTPFHNWEN